MSFTDQPTAAMSVCAVCAKVCHAGHEIEEDRGTQGRDFQCECRTGSCQAATIQWLPQIVRKNMDDTAEDGLVELNQLHHST